MSTYGDMPDQSGRDPHVESFQSWMDQGIKPVEDPWWHNEDIHTIWRPPPRCLTCGGHRVSSIRGRRPIQTRSLGFWAWLAELPMRWLAMSLRKKDSRDWSMEEDIPHVAFGTYVHQQIERHYRDTHNDHQDESAQNT